MPNLVAAGHGCYRPKVMSALRLPRLGLPRLGLPRLGVIAALLALAGQVAFTATLPQPVLLGIAFGTLCQTDAHGNAPAHPHRQVPPRAVSPLCIALALPAMPLVASPALPPRPAPMAAVMTRPPPATAPPHLVSLAAPPRGPPTLA